MPRVTWLEVMNDHSTLYQSIPVVYSFGKISWTFLNNVTLGKGKPPAEKFNFTASPTCWTRISLIWLDTVYKVFEHFVSLSLFWWGRLWNEVCQFWKNKGSVTIFFALTLLSESSLTSSNQTWAITMILSACLLLCTHISLVSSHFLNIELYLLLTLSVCVICYVSLPTCFEKRLLFAHL